MDVGLSRDANAQIQYVADPVAQGCQRLFLDFLEEWQLDEEDDDDQSRLAPTSTVDDHDAGLKYAPMRRQLVKAEHNTLTVSMKDVQRFNLQLAQSIQEQYYRIYPALCEAVRTFVKTSDDRIGQKDFYVSFIDVDAAHRLRELTTRKIGHLIRISAQVVRTHPVHPELVFGTFVCADCQTVVAEVEQQFKYTQPSICRNPTCSNRTRFTLDLDKSRFVDFQKIRVQEVQSELPRGSIPRTLDIVLRAEIVDSAQPGDRCDFTGTLIVVPDVGSITNPGARAETSARHRGAETEGVGGLKSLGVRDLHYKLAFLACSVRSSGSNRSIIANLDDPAEESEEVSLATIKKRMTPSELETVYRMSEDKDLYSHLTSSMFPTIHGNDEVKRGILLMLFGGVAKRTLEGTSLRGDINICLVGDPSTAKSQLLKQVADFSPRAVYTSGKASSAAGLTAAVVRDEESGEFVIEAGALMLADNGVCCIDEFDKMEVHDQVAIHEAMEQQTISITKAGVKATLNARTSILAAANPVSGRYDKSRPLKANIQMSAPIMSRFDLFYVLIDECCEVTDYAIARRIIDLHSRQEDTVQRVYTLDEISRYISFARLFKPRITDEAMEFFIRHYGQLRQRDAGGASSDFSADDGGLSSASSSSAKSSWRITVRQLESMIRLSEAMARMYCCEEVEPKHVREAFRLLNKSIIRVDQPDVQLDNGPDDDTAIDMTEDDVEKSVSDKNAKKDGAAVLKKLMKVSYGEYQRIANQIVTYLRSKEAALEDDIDGQDDSEESLMAVTGATRKSDVVTWYLTEMIDHVDSQEEMLQRKVVAEKVIDRLVYEDNVLIALNKTGLDDEASGHDKGDTVPMDDPYLVVHPNYVMED